MSEKGVAAGHQNLDRKRKKLCETEAPAHTTGATTETMVVLEKPGTWVGQNKY